MAGLVVLLQVAEWLLPVVFFEEFWFEVCFVPSVLLVHRVEEGLPAEYFARLQPPVLPVQDLAEPFVAVLQVVWMLVEE